MSGRPRHPPRYQVTVAQQEQRVRVVGIDIERRFQVPHRVLDSPARVMNPAAQLQSGSGGRLQVEHLPHAALGLDEGVLAEVDAGLPVLQIRQTQCGVQSGVVADDLQPVAQEMDGVIDRVLPPAPALLARAEVALVRVQVVDGALGEPSFFVGGEPELERIHDHPGETFLDREDILDGAVVGVRPQMIVRARVDELSRDPQPVSSSTHAALQDVSHPQLAGDRLHVLGRALERHGRRAGDDAQGAHLRQIGRHFVGETVREVLVLGVRAQVREGQHRDRLRPHGCGRVAGAGGRQSVDTFDMDSSPWIARQEPAP